MSNDNDGNDSLIDKARKLMGDNKLTSALADMVERKRGGLGFLLGILRKRPRAFNPFLMRGIALYNEPEALDRKTAELVAISAASALRCEHCLEAHMARAVKEGATLDEVMDTLLISGAIADSSTLSIAFRKYRQLEGKLGKEG
jgi:AhpD family alkylhydroperoxidase